MTLHNRNLSSIVILLVGSVILGLFVRTVLPSRTILYDEFEKHLYVGAEKNRIESSIELNLRLPNFKEKNRASLFVKSLDFSIKSRGVSFDEICFDGLRITNWPSGFHTWSPKNIPLKYNSVCRRVEGLSKGFSSGDPDPFFAYRINTSTIPTDELRLEMMEIPSSFWYPFDGYSHRISIAMDYSLKVNSYFVGKGESFPEVFLSYSEDPNWTVSLNTEDTVLSDIDRVIMDNDLFILDDGKSARFLHINLERPIFFTGTYVLLILFIFVLILLIPFSDTATFLQILLAVLFGILGVRQVLIPSELLERTLLDIIGIFLYAISFISMGVHFLHRNKKRSDGMNNLEKREPVATTLYGPQGDIITTIYHKRKRE